MAPVGGSLLFSLCHGFYQLLALANDKNHFTLPSLPPCQMIPIPTRNFLLLSPPSSPSKLEKEAEKSLGRHKGEEISQALYNLEEDDCCVSPEQVQRPCEYGEKKKIKKLKIYAINSKN